MALTKVTYSMIAGPTVSIADFGAVCDGVTDDITAINAAITYASSLGGGTVISTGPTLITSPILMKSNVHLSFDYTLTASGMSSAGTNFDDHAAILFEGTSISTTTLTSDATANDVTLQVTSATGLAVGDMVILEADSVWGGAATGEGIDSVLGRIVAVSGTSITIDNPVPVTIPVATALLRKVELIENASAYVKKIEGQPYDGFMFQWARNCTCRGQVNPIGKNAVYIHRAFGNHVHDVYGVNPVGNVVSPAGYGCLMDYGSSDNILENCYFEEVREVSTGHNARRNIFRNNTVIRPYDNGFNVHGLGEEDITFEGNTVINSQQYGIVIGQAAPSGKALNKRTIVRNNLIIDCVNYGIREVQVNDTAYTDTIIEGNVVLNNTATAIYIGGTGTATNNTNPVIRNNKIINSGGRGIEIATASVANCIIEGNEIESSATDGVLINSTRTNNIVRNNRIISPGSYGIRELQNTDDTLTDNIISGNHITNPANTAIYLSAAGTNRIRTNVYNNFIKSVGGAAGRGIELANTGVVECVVDSNVVDTTVGDGIIFNGAGDGHMCRHNTVRNIGGIGIRNTTAATRIIPVANRVESSTGARYSNLCAAAPTSGTWKAQDIMPNDANASAGGVIGWVCVTAGTPGTWKSFGAIAP